MDGAEQEQHRQAFVGGAADIFAAHFRQDEAAVAALRHKYRIPVFAPMTMYQAMEKLALCVDPTDIDLACTSQLTHCLQTATLAERAGADQEVVVASLCHDIGKAISVPNHPEIAASILKPYVRPEVHDMIRVHQDFQGRHYYHHFGGDPDAREKHRDALDPETFALAERFADEWDQVAFDPDGDTLPLEHFEPAVREVFGTPKLF